MIFAMHDESLTLMFSFFSYSQAPVAIQMKNKYMRLPDGFLFSLKFQFYFQIKEAGEKKKKVFLKVKVLFRQFSFPNHAVFSQGISEWIRDKG